jgi:squalene synthase HpnC
MRLGFPFVGREPGDLAGIRSSSSRPALPTRRKEGAGLERGSLTPELLLAKAAHENFPVALRLLPRSVRRHLMAIYGFARLVDDIGDEASGNRLAQLDVIDADIDRIYRGEAPKHPLLAEIAITVRAFDVPPEPLRRLVQANRQDQTVRRYRILDELVGYCELSANPVGHLVLYVFGSATPQRLALSDSICTGLQLVEHWQDVAEDLARDRIYLPQEDMARFGVDECDLAAPSAGEPLRRLMEFEVSRAGNMLSEGAPLIATLHGWARLAVAGFLAGGRAALAAIVAAEYDVLSYSPKPKRRRLARELSSVLLRKG